MVLIFIAADLLKPQNLAPRESFPLKGSLKFKAFVGIFHWFWFLCVRHLVPLPVTICITIINYKPHQFWGDVPHKDGLRANFLFENLIVSACLVVTCLWFKHSWPTIHLTQHNHADGAVELLANSYVYTMKALPLSHLYKHCRDSGQALYKFSSRTKQCYKGHIMSVKYMN